MKKNYTNDRGENMWALWNLSDDDIDTAMEIIEEDGDRLPISLDDEDYDNVAEEMQDWVQDQCNDWDHALAEIIKATARRKFDKIREGNNVPPTQNN